MKNENNQADILIKEARSEAAKERVLKFLKKHKELVSTFSIIILLLVVSVTIFGAYIKSQQEKYSAILHQAFIDEQTGEAEKANAALKEIHESSAPAGVKSIASLKYAASLVDKNKLEDAIKIYLEINKNKKYDPYIRELAGYIALKSLIDSGNKDEDRIAKLATDLEKNSKILKYFVLEQKAIFEWSRKNFDVANQIFKAIAGNPEAVGAVKIRASEMNKLYNSRFGIKEEKSEEKSDQKETKNKKEESEE